MTPASYANPPIVEAVLEIRVMPNETARLDQIARLESELYPHREQLDFVRGQIALTGAEVGATASREHAGYTFKSPDKQSLITARLDLFAFSRYAPYTAWEQLRNEARTQWTRYKDSVDPAGIVRVALRYINRITIPSTEVDLSEYFRTFPELSPGLPQVLGRYVMRMEIPWPDYEANLVINQSGVPSESEDSVSFVLDIDVFQMGPPITEERAWELLEKLHNAKNDAFEACITDRMRELFK